MNPEKMFPEGAQLFDAAWRVLENWQKPFVTAYGKVDPARIWVGTTRPGEEPRPTLLASPEQKGDAAVEVFRFARAVA
jgi:hypothetical protein